MTDHYNPRIYLASQSPRRKQLLQQIGVAFDVIDVDCDEQCLPDERPQDYVARVALDKTIAGQRALDDDPQAIVIGADTAVLVEGAILGKPKNQDDAFSMWKKMSGATHQVLSAVAVAKGNVTHFAVQTSQVTMREITPQEMRWYWETEEPCDKAGAYAVQGLGALFISHMAGSYSGVMGLPLFETAELLTRFNVLITKAINENNN